MTDDVIVAQQGTINEFIGAAILVIFGAPTAHDDDARRAVNCAVVMQLAMAEVNEKNEQLGLPAVEMGIGLRAKWSSATSARTSARSTASWGRR
jgi:adenylate cyclase